MRFQRAGSRRQATARDGGVTVVEMCVVVGILGVIMAAVAAAISVVLRSEGGVNTVVATSHDTQQVTNYFPIDVQGGPRLRSQYWGSGDPGRGSGCSDLGDQNIFRYDDGNRRLAYRLVPDLPSSTARIDRHECNFDGTSWTQTAIVNIADEVDTSAPTPLSVTFVESAGIVTRAVLSYPQTDGDVERMTGSPRLDSAAPAPAGVGDCADDPLEATAGFHVFSAGDVALRRGTTGAPGAALALGALAVGGSLTFENGTGVGQDWGNTDPSFDPSTVRMYLSDVDWANSSGVMKQNVGDTRLDLDPSRYVLTEGGGRPKILPPTSVAANPEIWIDNGSVGVVEPGTVIDFPKAFDELRQCAALVSMLPNSSLCATCEHANLWEHGSTPPTPVPYPGVEGVGGDQVKIEMDPSNDGGPTLVNLTSGQLTMINQISFYGTNRPSASEPLILNVSGGPPVAGAVTINFNVPQIENQGLYTNFIFWNFFDATTVTIDRTLTFASDETVWGSVFAPDATVVSTEKIWGGVVAQDYTQYGGTVNSSRTFEGIIPWL